MYNSDGGGKLVIIFVGHNKGNGSTSAPKLQKRLAA